MDRVSEESGPSLDSEILNEQPNCDLQLGSVGLDSYDQGCSANENTAEHSPLRSSTSSHTAEEQEVEPQASTGTELWLFGKLGGFSWYTVA